MKYNVTAIRQHQASRLLTRDYLETGKNILGDGLKLCQRAKAHNSQHPNTAIIAVKKKAVKEKVNNIWTTQIATIARMHDVAQCGNAHLCPHCSGFKASHLRNWISKKLEVLAGFVRLKPPWAPTGSMFTFMTC